MDAPAVVWQGGKGPDCLERGPDVTRLAGDSEVTAGDHVRLDRPGPEAGEGIYSSSAAATCISPALVRAEHRTGIIGRHRSGEAVQPIRGIPMRQFVVLLAVVAL